VDDRSPAQYLDDLTTIVSRAAAAVLQACAHALHTRIKADQSPVTAADHASEAVIMEGVSRLMPGIPIVSEEAVGRAPPRALDGTFVLVDPVDGTRELVAGRDEFVINLAIVHHGRPVLGVIAAPPLGLVWRAATGFGAQRLRLAPGAPVDQAKERTMITTRPWPAQGIVAAVSRSHLDPETQALLAGLPVASRLAVGSAMKFCRVAEGTADVYPRLARVCEWDVAAGDALVTIAGGSVTTPAGKPLAYGRMTERFVVPGFIAAGDRAAAARLIPPEARSVGS
jgi:3'(2'), 5'-bisphosphate nucleotidase